MAKTLIGNVKGPPGNNGVTPHIGENGNWWIGETDTGIVAAGADGANGVGIERIEYTINENDGQYNSLEIFLTDGKKKTCLIRNGSQGSDGADGQRGTGILKVTTAPSSYTTAIDDYTPKYRIALSTVKSQSGVAKVLLGDIIENGYYHYLIDYLDATYAYTSLARTSIRGATGGAGAVGANGVTFTPSVDANGNLSWSNDGGLTNPATVNIKGPAGNDGKDGASESVAVPDYWLEHLADKASAIQTAMEKAGRHKSAFLWYTDAHWPNGNSKVSPALLKYLYEHTPMNKCIFGGDIIGDSLLATRNDMEYLYEWRKAIKGLPNHHSVFGNHDKFDSSSVDYEDDNYRYAFLLAPEESPDMVMGDGNYYYIDNPAEKTRYLYLDYITGDQTGMMAQGQFVVDSLKSTPEGWHIVAIAHRWWQYNSSSAPLTGKIPTYETEILSVFDAYNARTTRSGSNYFYAQDFTAAKGKVEFCIGGHIHVDYDIESAGGIPVIITTSDTNQNRVHDSTVDSGTVGTTTEAAVFGIIADYTDADNTKINVIGVGRGTSRVVRKSTVKPTSISDITYSGDTTVGATIDKNKFSFTVNYNTGATDTINGAASVSPATIGVVGDNAVTITYIEGATTVSGTVTIVGTAVPVANLFDKNDADVVDTGRFNSSNAAVAYQSGQLVTGYIAATVGDTFTVISDKSAKTNNYTGTGLTYKTDKSAIGQFSQGSSFWNRSADGLTSTITIPATNGSADHSATAYIRFCVPYTDIDSIVITKA